jgi:hypothetical protein
MIKEMYLVMTIIPWDQVKVNGQGLVPMGLGIGFLPVFDSLEVAKNKFPRHPITSIAQEVPDDLEVSGRPTGGGGNGSSLLPGEVPSEDEARFVDLPPSEG